HLTRINRFSRLFVVCNFFFFQAEDGIRDGHVTGVQTCALPICFCEKRKHCELTETNAGEMMTLDLPTWSATADLAALSRALGGRSEERRVGKECRCRWAP